MLPTCNRQFPRDCGKGRPCLNYHIKQCMAPCTGRVRLKDYNENLNRALEFLRGGSTNSIKKLTEEMETAAENLEFERAASIRDIIKSVRKMSDKQKVVATKIDDGDVIAGFSDDGKTCYQIFRFEGGRLFDRESFVFDSGESESETEEFYCDITLCVTVCQRELQSTGNLTVWKKLPNGSRKSTAVRSA